MENKLPAYFKQLFWSYDFSRLDAEKDMRRIVVDTINYGALRHWKWLSTNYGKEAVRKIIETTTLSEFRPRALRLAALLFGAEKSAYASRSAYARRT